MLCWRCVPAKTSHGPPLERDDNVEGRRIGARTADRQRALAPGSQKLTWGNSGKDLAEGALM